MEDNLQDYTYIFLLLVSASFTESSSMGPEKKRPRRSNGRYPTPSRDEANRATTFALNLRKYVAVVRLFSPFSTGVSRYTNLSRRFSRKSAPTARWMKIHGRLEKLTRKQWGGRNGNVRRVGYCRKQRFSHFRDDLEKVTNIFNVRERFM